MTLAMKCENGSSDNAGSVAYEAAAAALIGPAPACDSAMWRRFVHDDDSNGLSIMDDPLQVDERRRLLGSLVEEMSEMKESI
jgi:hypothetical protein